MQRAANGADYPGVSFDRAARSVVGNGNDHERLASLPPEVTRALSWDLRQELGMATCAVANPRAVPSAAAIASPPRRPQGKNRRIIRVFHALRTTFVYKGRLWRAEKRPRRAETPRTSPPGRRADDDPSIQKLNSEPPLCGLTSQLTDDLPRGGIGHQRSSAIKVLRKPLGLIILGCRWNLSLIGHTLCNCSKVSDRCPGQKPIHI